MLSRRQILRASLGAMPLALGAPPRHALAQASPAGEAWPSRPIRLVVTWAPGGAVDTIARRAAPKLVESRGRPVVVESKSGATGTIGAADVARATPDGHTLLAMDKLLRHAALPVPTPALRPRECLPDGDGQRLLAGHDRRAS